MPTSIKKMNKSLYYASAHLLEASKYLSNIEDFREESHRLLLMAQEMADIIKPEPEKIPEEKMKSILDEIMNFNDGK